MLAILFSLIGFTADTQLPEAAVVVPEAEVEAVFVPQGHRGPVVAVPFDEAVF
jgi:hypothetical protein